MKTIKIIDLYNLIANEDFDKLPKKIKTGNIIWNYNREANTYFMDNSTIELFYIEEITKKLNDEVEILDEKEIPEKLKIEQDTSSGNYYIKNEFGTKCYLTKHSKIFADKINEILDYLEIKGE